MEVELTERQPILIKHPFTEIKEGDLIIVAYSGQGEVGVREAIRTEEAKVCGEKRRVVWFTNQKRSTICSDNVMYRFSQRALSYFRCEGKRIIVSPLSLLVKLKAEGYSV